MKTKAVVGLVLAWIGTVATAYWAGGGSNQDRSNVPWKTKAGSTVASPSSGGLAETTHSKGTKTAKSESPGTGPTGTRSALDRLKATVSITDVVERARAFLDCLGELDSEGFAAAADWMSQQGGRRGHGPGGGGERMQEMLLLHAWGKKDPEGALAWTKGKDGMGSFTVLSAWAEIDPQKAAAWAQANPSEGGPFGRGRGGPGGGEGTTENWNLLGVISGAAKTNPTVAAGLVESMGDGHARGEALSMVLDELYKSNPQAAKDWAAKMTDETMKASAVRRVANRMAQEDPAQAAAYALAQTDTESKSRAIAEVASEWAQKDAAAAGQWLNQQPKGEETDRARREYAFEIQRDDPSAAMAWAATITDPQQRDESVLRLASDWLRTDEAAAKAWIESQPNASDALKNLPNQPQQRGPGGFGNRRGRN